jgi:LmbE family N-acetylglucosaminyl deacetylase
MRSSVNQDLDKIPSLPTWVVRVRSVVLVLVGILCFLLFLSAYEIYTANGSVDSTKLPLASSVTSAQSILIVSPHPDDETLGLGGFILQAKEHGAKAHVVFMTCGDGFKAGVAQYYGHVAPSDFKRYGEMRIKETQAALGCLGLKRSDITYLGYPDGGTSVMWKDHWLGSDPFKAPFTRASHVFYPEAYDVGAPFSGESMLRDLMAVIEQNKPTDIYVTHPNDDHPDHSTASALATLAVNLLRQSPEPWAKNVRIHYFIVHRGDWPIPQGMHFECDMPPPAKLIDCDTQWSKVRLSRNEEKTLAHAIQAYQSQGVMMHRFLASFVRKNEIIGEIPREREEIDIPSPGDEKTIAFTSKSSAERPLSIDPVGDSVLLSLQKGADIRSVWVRPDGNFLDVRLEMNGELLPELQYEIVARGVNFFGESSDHAVDIRLSPQNQRMNTVRKAYGGSTVSWKDNTVDAKIPIETLGLSRDGILFVEGFSKAPFTPCDRTGPRAIRICTPMPIASSLDR